MELNRIQQNTAQQSGYRLSLGERKEETSEIHPDHYETAQAMDADNNQIITLQEMRDHLRSQNILKDPEIAQVDEESIINDYGMALQNRQVDQRGAYRSYESMTAEMKELTSKHPDRAKMVSLGKSFEGREIWDLVITSGGDRKADGTKKPGVLITGLTHAREWATGEAPMYTAHQLLEKYDTDPAMKNRLDNTVIHIVANVNPDGSEYSKNVSSFWRKNRQAITQEMLDNNSGPVAGERNDSKGKVIGYGVDLNRNYMDDDPKNFHLYRPTGDTPQSNWDDDGASDSVGSDTYRGPGGGLTPEISAMQNFMQNPENNIKGAIDFHSYGRMILYPMGANYDEVDNSKEYISVAQKMADSIRNADNEKVSYRVIQSSGLYPATGSAEDFEYSNGILGMTLEIGKTFFPRENEIEPMCKRLLGAQMVMIDHFAGETA